MNAEKLKLIIIKSLKRQGFRVNKGKICPPESLDKQKLRDLHASVVKHRVENAKDKLSRHESKLLSRLASGQKIIPNQISPYLVEVQPESENELLFRYVSLHWSIPISSGYGRRLRFLVIDKQNEKLIGIIGLGDPVFSLAARDKRIGWSPEDRRSRLRHVMDAFVLGAVPPYSFLLCGKLVAMLVASNEIRYAFKKKYEGDSSLIKRKPFDG